MRILLINQVFVSPDEPGHTRHFELAKFMQQQGHELVIVASDVNYQTGKKTIAHSGLSIEQNIAGIRVFRSAIIPSLHRSYFWRILSFFSFMFSSIWTALKVKDVDLIMGTTPPIFQAVSAWFVAFVRRKPFLLEVRDLWPEFIVSMGEFRNPVLIQMARWLERFLYAHASHILVNSPAYGEYIEQKGVAKEKISFIPYGTDIEMFSPGIDGSEIRNRYGLKDNFVVLYSGALGQANDIYTVIRAAQRLQPKSAIKIILFGDGKEREKLEADAKSRKLENIIFAGALPKKEMPAVLAAADVCLAILQDIPMFRTTYPNKVFDYMAAGKATILVIDGVIRDVIEASKGGIFVKPGDDKQLADVLSGLATDPARVIALGQQAREYLIKNLDRRNKMAETVNLMKELTAK